MKGIKKNRIIIAWILLMVLMPISFVKATHFHECEETAVSHADDQEHSHEGDGCDSCPICHFLLSPFLETPTYHFSCCAQVVLLFIVRPCLDHKGTCVRTISLRAPPASRII